MVETIKRLNNVIRELGYSIDPQPGWAAIHIPKSGNPSTAIILKSEGNGVYIVLTEDKKKVRTNRIIPIPPLEMLKQIATELSNKYNLDLKVLHNLRNNTYSYAENNQIIAFEHDGKVVSEVNDPYIIYSGIIIGIYGYIKNESK